MNMSDTLGGLRGLGISEYGHIAYQIKRNDTCSNMVAYILPADPPPPPSTNLGGGGGSKGQNSTFSEYGHVVYHIKGNDACSNMVANILPADIPLGITNAATW